MRFFLTALFSAILICMIVVTTAAALERSMFTAGEELLKDRWFVATLCDAYFGFLTFYVWVAYRETSFTGRLLWFLLIMLLGNIAMAVYVLWRLGRLPGDAPLSALLIRPEEIASVSLEPPA